MSSIESWVLVLHLMAWVFWLGTDVGVFLATRFSERGDLSVETRLTVLHVGMLLDRLPRLAVPIVWVSGIYLSGQFGVTLIPLAVALPLGLIWLLATWAIIMQPPGSFFQRIGLHLQTIIYSGVILVMGLGGTYWLVSGELPLWLALKWFAYVVIAIAALSLEKRFKPVIAAYGELASQGADDALNARISLGLKPVYNAVLVIYAATVVAGISGIIKPG
jgi:hypothetical protein